MERSNPFIVGRNIRRRRLYLAATVQPNWQWSRKAIARRSTMTEGWWQRVEMEGQELPASSLQEVNRLLRIPVETPDDVFLLLWPDFDPETGRRKVSTVDSRP